MIRGGVVAFSDTRPIQTNDGNQSFTEISTVLMGQSQSSPPPSNPLTKTQQLFLSLSKTLPPLTLQDYNTIFSSLAESSAHNDITYWKEDTLARYLQVPAKIGSLLFKSCSYLAALPTLDGVPVPLDKEGLGIAVMVLTQRVPKQVLTEREAQRLLFNSFAEIPPNEPHKEEKHGEGGKEGHEKRPRSEYGPQIPVQTMTELILFLLSITTSSTMTSAETTLLQTTSPESRHAVVECATSLISALQRYSKHPSDGISYDAFRVFLEHDAPYFFDSLVPLFQKFLYDKHKWGTNPTPREDWRGALECEDVEGSVLGGCLAQMNMFFPKERRVGKLVPLYMGSKDGFSMGMFESKVLKYPGPTILLVKGTTEESSETKYQSVLFGVYISTPWKSSTKDNFGDKSSLLFQLQPTHTLYPSSPYHTQIAYFAPRIGIGFGSPPPQLLRRQSMTSQTLIQHTSDPQVSLSLDPALELAHFTHIPPGATFTGNAADGEFKWGVEVGEVEVWGCGVEDAREEQRRAWEYERREAERRQNLRVREDLSSDRALLEMAGLIGGGNRSGGSM